MKALIIGLFLITLPTICGSSAFYVVDVDTPDIVRSGILDPYPDLKAQFINISFDYHWEKRQLDINLKQREDRLRAIERAGEMQQQKPDTAKDLE